LQNDKSKRLGDQLTELNAKLANVAAAAEKGTADPTKSVEDIISAEELATLKEEAPVLGATFEKLISRISTLEQTAHKVEVTEGQRELDAVQTAIDANPKLVFVQANDPEKFDAIAAIDTWAKDQPSFKGLSLGDRFTKVVAMYESAHGPIDLPASASGKPKESPDAKAKADAAIAKAMEDAAPNTLTDIPGGNPPPKNDLEAVAGMSAVALTDHFMKLDQKATEAFLAKFG